MDLIFNHTWLFFLAVAIINCFFFKAEAQKLINRNPDLKAGYNKIFLAYSLFHIIPWIIMAIGDMNGMTKDVWEYLHPGSRNPIVLAFHCTILGMWLITTFWIFFFNGADFLARHPGILRLSSRGGSVIKELNTTSSIKIFFLCATLTGIAVLTLLWFWDFAA
jgi:hypothetical protein